MSHYIAYFFGCVFFANVVVNLWQGKSGRAFPTPFAIRRVDSKNFTY